MQRIAPKHLLAKPVVRLIDAYRDRGGGKHFFGVECNFSPTCSDYTKTALQEDGLWRGGHAGWQRIRRCINPDQVGKLNDPYRGDNMLEALTLRSEDVADHEEALRVRIRALTDANRLHYFKRFKSDLKDPDTYAVLNWFFLAGLHHMYLGNWLRGAINLVILIAGIALLFSAFTTLGMVVIAALLAIELMALFRSQTVVANHNNLLAESILDELEREV
ncbi:MAG: membrane protein insertion efficiency factor YidD [Pseudomonadales bacterium]|nr:membrane protein insertion efficiency factor YidD [Pseudomonadales bacterium]